MYWLLNHIFMSRKQFVDLVKAFQTALKNDPNARPLGSKWTSRQSSHSTHEPPAQLPLLLWLFITGSFDLFLTWPLWTCMHYSLGSFYSSYLSFPIDIYVDIFLQSFHNRKLYCIIKRAFTNQEGGKISNTQLMKTQVRYKNNCSSRRRN